MASHQHGPQCCCDCPTKEATGLPDSIVATFSGLTSSASGMPADEEAGECEGAEPFFYRFTHSAAFMEMLSSIAFDYEESATSDACGTCCFLYEGRKEYSADCAGDTSGPWIYFGSNPFAPYTIGEQDYRLLCRGPFVEPCDSTPSGGDCCDDACSELSEDFCSEDIHFVGSEYTPGPVYGTATLAICVQGSVVTICKTITMYAPCEVLTGEYQAVRHAINVAISCDFFDDVITDTTVAACAGDADVLVIELTETQDLSAVSGADIWEKIKNASWTFGYEQLKCNCGGGCMEDAQVDIYECALLAATCICSGGGDLLDGSMSGAVPIDQQCLYAIGEIDIAFEDE